jgi:hypothetical protein
MELSGHTRAVPPGTELQFLVNRDPDPKMPSPAQTEIQPESGNPVRADNRGMVNVSWIYPSKPFMAPGVSFTLSLEPTGDPPRRIAVEPEEYARLTVGTDVKGGRIVPLPERARDWLKDTILELVASIITTLLIERSPRAIAHSRGVGSAKGRKKRGKEGGR